MLASCHSSPISVSPPPRCLPRVLESGLVPKQYPVPLFSFFPNAGLSEMIYCSIYPFVDCETRGLVCQVPCCAQSPSMLLAHSRSFANGSVVLSGSFAHRMQEARTTCHLHTPTESYVTSPSFQNNCLATVLHSNGRMQEKLPLGFLILFN